MPQLGIRDARAATRAAKLQTKTELALLARVEELEDLALSLRQGNSEMQTALRELLIVEVEQRNEALQVLLKHLGPLSAG